VTMATGPKPQEPQSYTWTFPICPHDVAVDFAVVRTLAAGLAEDAGPLQGLLLGERQAGLTRIAAVEPLPSLDTAGIAARVSAASRPVVGYYRIRQGCAFILEAGEVALAKGLFRDPGSLVLLVERRESGAAEAAFAFWRGGAFVSNLPRPFPLDAAALAEQTQAALPSPEPAESRLAALRRNATPIGLVAAAVAGILILPLIWLRSGPPPERTGPLPAASAPSPVYSMVSHTPGDIEIAWDRASLSTATAGLLKIEDGGVRHHISLDLDQLRSGRIVYTPAGPGAVEAELKVLLVDGEMVEIPVTRRAAPGVPASPAVRAPATPVPVLVAKLRPRRFRDPRTVPDAKPVRIVKRFIASAAGPAPPRPPALPDAPPVQMAAPAAPILAASLSAPAPPARIRLGPPPPTDRVTPAGSGRLIWSGILARRGVVEFEGRSVSVGSLTGALPGVPVHVTVSPAEFASDGLVVYTTNASLNGHVEPPGAANGWNRITYIWDPERARQIAVLETPNPSNRFSHLALRSDARHVSMLVIDWQAQTAATR
jgi:hypothetical protein